MFLVVPTTVTYFKMILLRLLQRDCKVGVVSELSVFISA